MAYLSHIYPLTEGLLNDTIEEARTYNLLYMPSIFSTALMGLLLLPSASTTVVTANPWVKTAPIEPIYQQYTVSMTGYNAVAEQTDGTPDYSASGLRVNPEIDAAVSRDMLDKGLPFGTIVELVPGTATSTVNCGLSSVDDSIGYRVVTDTMNARYSNFMDILFDIEDTVTVGKLDRNKAKAIGLCRDVQIRVVGHVELDEVPATQKALKAIVAKQMPEFAKGNVALLK